MARIDIEVGLLLEDYGDYIGSTIAIELSDDELVGIEYLPRQLATLLRHVLWMKYPCATIDQCDDQSS